MEKLKFNPNNKKYYSDEFIKGFECGVERQFNLDMAENTSERAIETLQNQKTGHWIEGQRNNLEIHNILCSNCLEGYTSKGHANSQYTREKFKFCPNCGAKMIEEGEEKNDRN